MMSRDKAIKTGYYSLAGKEISKLIRKDLKKEFGKKIKFSVTTDSGYTTVIRIKVLKASKDLFKTEQEFKTEYEKYLIMNEVQQYKDLFYRFKRNDDLSLKNEVFDKIETIGNKYNYDDSDPMTDYFDKNYICFVTGYKIEKI